MGNIFFTSDLHFGHANILRYDNRPFESVEEMDYELVRRWNERVSPEDTVYVLGDVSWYDADKTKQLVSSLNGRKILIRGNHDKPGNGKIWGFDEEYDYKEIRPNGKKSLVVLSHYPITFFNRHHYGAYMLYGHVHATHEWNITENVKRQLERLDIPCNMFNVGCMLWDYAPVTLEEIIADQRFQKEQPEGTEV